MKKIKYNKLIRDKILEISKANGTVCDSRILDSEEFKAELLQKLTEEATEVKKAESKQDITDELADVSEVIRAIQKEFAITDSEIEAARLKKLDIRGGFDQKIYLISATYKD